MTLGVFIGNRYGVTAACDSCGTTASGVNSYGAKKMVLVSESPPIVAFNFNLSTFSGTPVTDLLDGYSDFIKTNKLGKLNDYAKSFIKYLVSHRCDGKEEMLNAYCKSDEYCMYFQRLMDNPSEDDGWTSSLFVQVFTQERERLKSFRGTSLRVEDEDIELSFGFMLDKLARQHFSQNTGKLKELMLLNLIYNFDNYTGVSFVGLGSNQKHPSIYTMYLNNIICGEANYIVDRGETKTFRTKDIKLVAIGDSTLIKEAVRLKNITTIPGLYSDKHSKEQLKTLIAESGGGGVDQINTVNLSYNLIRLAELIQSECGDSITIGGEVNFVDIYGNTKPKYFSAD